MIRAVHLVTFVGALIAGIGVTALILILTSTPDALPQGTQANAQTGSTSQDSDRQIWPALFGTPEAAPRTKSTEVAEIAEEYELKGMVAGGRQSWAIVSGPDGDKLVAVGSELSPGEIVVAITADGVETERDGKRRMIGFTASDDTAPKIATAPSVPRPLAKATTLSLKELRDGDFRRMLALSGGVKVIDRGNGALAQQIMWVRNGRLYDRIGLREGDIVVTINGVPAGNGDALAAAVPDLLRQREFELVLIRSGAQMRLKVTIDENV